MNRMMQLVPVMSKEQYEVQSLDTMVNVVNATQQHKVEVKARMERRRRQKIKRIVNMVLDLAVLVTSLLGVATIIAFLMTM
ncbi:MAG: hypothetical protein IKC09_08840 [Oscillospiraceae bacterium]|nr:hypothetical protein [Oscillospiraceae bacterium]